jgi:DNA-binding NtrC family response regulator
MVVATHALERNILLVTSQQEVLEPLVAVIRTILQQLPNTVQPEHALREAGGTSYDLTIIDMQSGSETLQFVRQFKERFPEMPLITIVPYGNVGMVEQIIAHGADDYISQPISIERLRTTLRNALRLRMLLLGANAGTAERYRLATGSRNDRWLSDADGRWRTLKEIEDMAIDHAIRNCDGCITQAARLLGVGRSTLYRKMQEKLSARQQARESHTTRPMIAASSGRDS